MKTPDIFVDRSNFIAWTQGTLLYRTPDRMVVGDHVDHERAERILEEGGIVGLLENGKLVSTMQYDEEMDGYVEQDVEQAV